VHPSREEEDEGLAREGYLNLVEYLRPLSRETLSKDQRHDTIRQCAQPHQAKDIHITGSAHTDLEREKEGFWEVKTNKMERCRYVGSVVTGQ